MPREKAPADNNTGMPMPPGLPSDDRGWRTTSAALKRALAVALSAVPLGLATFTAPGAAQDTIANVIRAVPVCEVDRPIVMAALDWDSSAFHNAVASFILEKGYGCQTSYVEGSTIPLLSRMARGQIDVTMEMWSSNVEEAWKQAVGRGAVRSLGVNFPDATQAWFVPKYLVEGDDAPAKGLKSVADLPRYKDLFADPDAPGKGRFYNCILGWGCEVINTKKLFAYGLTDSYTNYRPGTGAALASTIETDIQNKKPIVFYYWGPTWLLGKVGDQIVELEEPAYDEAIWTKLLEAPNPADVTQATAYPLVAVYKAVNTGFAETAPGIIEFLSRYETTNAMVSKALAYMQDNNATADEAAVHFLKENPDVWSPWVPAEVADTVKAALGNS
ncbi:glycine betaine/proline transport system substrate-binding protein [Amorphus suaedae]